MHTRKNLLVLSFTLFAMLITQSHAFSDSFKLRQDGEEADETEGYATVTERNFDYINAFLAGFRSQETIPSATNCTKNLEVSIFEFNQTTLNWKDEEYAAEMNTEDYLFNVTSWISFQLAPSSRHCIMSGIEVYAFGLLKQSQFDTFSDVFQAWLQNLLGNVITFNSLYSKVEEAIEAGNFKEMYYWYGRFATLFLVFEPIETDADELSDGFDEQFILSAMGTGGAFVSMEQEKRNTRVNKSPHVKGVFGNLYGFTSGYINATFGDSSPNADICQTNLTRIVDQSKEFVIDVKNATEESLANATDAFEAILASVHPITYSCYSSVDEFGETSDHYMETFSSFSKITYNLVHKLGNIYDTIFYLLQHQQKYSLLAEESEEEAANWWFKLGIYYGTTTFLMFYTPEEHDPYDPMDEYTGLGNGDHLDKDEETVPEATEEDAVGTL